MTSRELEYQKSIQKIYSRLKSQRSKYVLKEMVTVEGTRLAKAFSYDANHSWYVVGDIFWKLGSYRLALDSFKRSLRSWPGDAEATCAIGNCYSELDNHVLAERYFRKAVTLDKKNPGYLFNLANALFDQGNFEGAKNIYLSIERAPQELRKKILHNVKLSAKLLSS